jgi:hypothetical protein
MRPAPKSRDRDAAQIALALSEAAGAAPAPPSAFSTQEVYVNKGGSDTTGNGTILKPYLTITKALLSITDNSATKRYGVFVGPGLYAEVWQTKPWVGVIGAAAAANGATPDGAMLTEISAPANTIGFDPSWSGAGFGVTFLQYLGFENQQTFNQATVPGIEPQINADSCSFNGGIVLLGPGTVGFDNATFVNCISYGGFTVTGWQYLWLRQCVTLGGAILVQAGPAGATENTNLLAENCSLGSPTDTTTMTFLWAAPSPAGISAIGTLVNTTAVGQLTLNGVHTTVDNVVGTVADVAFLNGAVGFTGTSLGVHTVTSSPGSPPSIAVGGAAGGGASAAIASTSTDNAGAFTVTTGTGPSTGVLATVTYDIPYPTTSLTPPNVVFSRTDAQTVGQFYVSSFTNAGFVISASVAPSAGETYGFTFISLA